MTRELWLSSWQGQEIYHLYSVQTGCGASQPSIQWILGSHSPEVKWLVCEAHLHLVLRLRMQGETTPLPHTSACTYLNTGKMLPFTLRRMYYMSYSCHYYSFNSSNTKWRVQTKLEHCHTVTQAEWKPTETDKSINLYMTHCLFCQFTWMWTLLLDHCSWTCWQWGITFPGALK